MVENEPTPYRKLSGHVISWTGPSSVWMADDHLLYIFGYFTEEYRRFYFNDIEALVIQRTSDRMIQAVILTLLSILLLLPFLFMPDPWRILGIIPAGFFIIGLIINQIRGSGCTVRLVTSVNDIPIRCLAREPLARKALAALQPALQAVQGDLTGHEIPVQRPTPAVVRSFESPVEARRSESGIFHVLSCILLLGIAIVSGVCLAYHHATVASFGLGLFVILLICVLMSLLRQARSDMRQSVKNWTWAVFIYLMVNSVIGYVYFIAASIKNAGEYTSEYEVLRMALEQSPYNSAMLLVIYILTLAGALLLSLIGAVTLANFFSFRTPPGEPVSPPALENTGEPEAG